MGGQARERPQVARVLVAGDACLGPVREQSNQLGRVTAPCVMAGEGRPTTTLLLAAREEVGGRARPGHDTGLCGVAG